MTLEPDPISVRQIGTATPVPALTPGLSDRVAILERQIVDLSDQVKQPEKDFWDIVESISGLCSGILIAIIGAIATYIYNQVQQKNEAARKERELAVEAERTRRATEIQVAQNEQQLAVLQVQTIQAFMPQLQSGDEKHVQAALLAISALGNDKLARDLAILYRGPGAFAALSRIATSADEQIAEQAERTLEKLFESKKNTLVKVQISGQGIRTGFLVDPNGHVVTVTFEKANAHDAQVKWNNQTYPARVVLESELPFCYLSLVKFGHGQLPFLILGDSSAARAGDDLFLLRLEEQGTLDVKVGQMGGSTSIQRDDSSTSYQFIDALVKALAGDEGAPLVSIGGHLIGVVAVTNEYGHSLLIPSSFVSEFLDKANLTAHQAA